MASQQVRNMINSQIDSLLIRAEAELKNEGKKKLNELQNELLTPDTILKVLKIKTDDVSCSSSGIEKYEKIRKKLLDKLDKIKTPLNNAIEKLEGIDSKIRPLIRGEGAIGQIKKLKDDIINPIILPILTALSYAIPPALFAIPTPPPGVPGLGGVIPKLSTTLEDAVVEIKKLQALMMMISFMLEYYIKKAERVMLPFDILMPKLKFLQSEIGKLEAFIHSLYLNQIEGCNELTNAANISVNSDTMTGNEGSNVLPDPTGPTPLDQYLSLLQNQYEDVYQKVLNSTNKKYVERVFALKETLEEDYNISFKTIKN